MTMTDEVTAICAVVPAHNEQAFIGRCLDSLTAAARYTRGHRPDVHVRIVIVADSCTDDTAHIASSFPGIDVLTLHARSVGAARAEGVDFALAAFRHDPNFDPAGTTGWIANTDTDSAVPEHWFTAQIGLAETGFDVIVGTVRPDFDDLTPEQITAWEARHTPGRPNGHVHGANLGIRASTYTAANGFQPQAEHEDVDLVQRLRDLGARLVASENGEVLTSGRQVGKTPGGYARYLAENLIPDEDTDAA
jgi:glycosyltransferase involved in cell wall biosynthesis